MRVSRQLAGGVVPWSILRAQALCSQLRRSKVDLPILAEGGGRIVGRIKLIVDVQREIPELELASPITLRFLTVPDAVAQYGFATVERSEAAPWLTRAEVRLRGDRLVADLRMLKQQPMADSLCRREYVLSLNGPSFPTSRETGELQLFAGEQCVAQETVTLLAVSPIEVIPATLVVRRVEGEWRGRVAVVDRVSGRRLKVSGHNLRGLDVAGDYDSEALVSIQVSGPDHLRHTAGQPAEIRILDGREAVAIVPVEFAADISEEDDQ